MNALAEQALDGKRGQAAALGAAEIAELKQLLANWDIQRDQQVPHLVREFRFRNFAAALHFANTVGALAEEADHHPALLLEWGKVRVSWWTHSIGALHLNDFIMAARCDRAYLNSPEQDRQ
jgi:4a-hydroxytetrahydrobiopterin dehydratase